MLQVQGLLGHVGGRPAGETCRGGRACERVSARLPACLVARFWGPSLLYLARLLALSCPADPPTPSRSNLVASSCPAHLPTPLQDSVGLSEEQLLQFVLSGGLDGGCTRSEAALAQATHRLKQLLLVGGWWCVCVWVGGGGGGGGACLVEGGGRHVKRSRRRCAQAAALLLLLLPPPPSPIAGPACMQAFFPSTLPLASPPSLA